MRRRLSRHVGLLVAALLVLPLLAHGHGHRPSETSAPCAVCVVAHTPVVRASVTAAPTLVVREIALAAAREIVSSRTESRPHAGRAPPAPRTTQVA